MFIFLRSPLGLKDGRRAGHANHPLTWRREAAAAALVAPVVNSSGREVQVDGQSRDG